VAGEDADLFKLKADGEDFERLRYGLLNFVDIISSVSELFAVFYII
jgi:hypothetical protein